MPRTRRLPQQEEADPQELLNVDILFKSQGPGSLVPEGPKCIFSQLLPQLSHLTPKQGKWGRHFKGSCVCCINSQCLLVTSYPPSRMAYLNRSKEVTYSLVSQILLSFYFPSDKDIGKASLSSWFKEIIRHKKYVISLRNIVPSYPRKWLLLLKLIDLYSYISILNIANEDKITLIGSISLRHVLLESFWRVWCI